MNKLLVAMAVSSFALSIGCQTIGGIPLPDNWHFFGDSQTAGRASATPLTISHAVAFENIWISNNETVPYTYRFGVGGRSLAKTMQAYMDLSSVHIDDWVHIQESGNQNWDGQQTPEDFANTFEQFVQAIIERSPNATITMETAYSFERFTAGKDWTEHNIALRSKVSQMQASGHNIYLVDVEPAISDLVALLGFQSVVLEDGGHYTGIGNLLIALLMFKSLGYDINALDLQGISDISDYDKAQCLFIINQL